MKIAVFSSLAFGGAATAAMRLTKALIDYGHECSFFTLESSGNTLHITLQDNFWLSSLFKHWSSLTKPEAMAVNTAEFFSDTVIAFNVFPSLPKAIHDADVIHLHWVSGMLFSPFLLSIMTNKKIIWTLHDENAYTGGCHFSGKCIKFQSKCEDCHLLKNNNKYDISFKSFDLKEKFYHYLNPNIVTPSAWLEERVKKSTLLKNYTVTTIPNPLDTNLYQPIQNKLALRKKLKLPKNTFLILTGCEYINNTRKNTIALFEALNLLANKYSNIPISVITYGHNQPPKSILPVYHFGYITDENKLIELYNVADLFVHTALQDNLATTLCEAQACGTPTLCFDVGGCSETMLSEKTGFLVTETTSQVLSEKIYSIFKNNNSLENMREEARSFAEKRFNRHTIAASYTELFEKAQPSQGIKTTDSFFIDLIQNQISSLATTFHEYNNEFNINISKFESKDITLSKKQTHKLKSEKLYTRLKYIFILLFPKNSFIYRLSYKIKNKFKK
jgi:glycosyltransferase involved in cell wall biosynthesis